MPKNNVQAKHRQPPMPLAARHSFSNGSKSRSQETSQRVQVMFKAKYIYKNYAFSIFDHTTMRKKTHQNELDGWKQDGWALALAKISSFAISSMAPKTSTFFDLKTCLRSKAPHSSGFKVQPGAVSLRKALRRGGKENNQGTTEAW